MTDTRLADVLRAEACGLDTSPGPHGLHIYAMDETGTLYELGSIDHTALGQMPPDHVQRAVERIKFGQRRKDEETNQ